MKQKDAVEILTLLDVVASTIPDSYRWPHALRLNYEKAVRLLKKYITN